MSLKTLQHQFQSYLLKNDNTILSAITSGHMSIYQNGYYERIISALKQDFPVLCEQIGESAFAGLITDYLQSHPSTHYNLRTVGKYLSEFILSRDADFSFYAELARLEWLICTESEEMKLFQSEFSVVDLVTTYYEGRIK